MNLDEIEAFCRSTLAADYIDTESAARGYRKRANRFAHADVPALIARVRELEAECERNEAKAHVVCLEALLREKTEECDELDEERREAWQHVQNNMSHVFLKGAHGALADAGDVEVPPLTEPIDEAIRAIVRERDEARAEVQRLTDERDEARNLVDALRSSGLTTDDCQAVETIYAVAGHVGSHRIVEAMRYLRAWIVEAKP
jgi:Ribonuclease G/E